MYTLVCVMDDLKQANQLTCWLGGSDSLSRMVKWLPLLGFLCDEMRFYIMRFDEFYALEKRVIPRLCNTNIYVLEICTGGNSSEGDY